MVHYGQKTNVTHLPPASCPKCGSHRTDLVGHIDDTKFVTVRCNSCGERSPLDVQNADSHRSYAAV
jgi:uncharacterized Zn finger protein